MKINYDRIHKAQELMTQQGMIGIMIMNHDDFRYFFGAIRVQPRAIIPAAGSPVFICFKGEEPELRNAVGDDNIKVFAHVGEQISDVKKTFHSLFKGPPPGVKPPSDGRPKVGMQMWFHTPAFLVDLFRKINKEMELVSSDSVMDQLRMVKGPEEIELMKKAQSIAALGMDKAKEMLSPGISGHEMATEILYTMMKAWAEGTSTPIHINPGTRSCW
ncbi:MAG: aminopeptidase P family N-terminal domain-containing protein, partial [Nitrospinota bacterium]|nr:aminopeptidase P family N-terminal domain-containing protein [Nitrospinota bacterium]